jgi:hypothetical protein
MPTDDSEEYIASIFRPEEKDKHKTSLKYSFSCWLLHAGFLLGLLFNPEDGGDMFLRNVG